MRILLVFTEISVKFGKYGFQHGIASLSAYLKSKGYHHIKLCYLSPYFLVRPFHKILSNYQPDIIGFYTTHDQFRFILKLIQEIENTNIFILCGGPHVTLNPEILYEIPRIDAVCIGEGEEPLLELIKILEKKEKPTSIKNLWIRNGGRIIKNPTRPFLENLDILPFADRDLFSNIKIWNRIGLTQICYKNSFRISRGCPYQCSFCSNKQMGTSQTGLFMRFRSVDNVLKEIESVLKRFSPQEIYFEDDSFTLNELFIDEFCEKYPKRIGLPFEFLSHIDSFTIKMLEKLKKAGGRRVSFGIESGNETLRKNILKKFFSNREVVQIFKEAKKIGYYTEAFVMVGLPEETPESFNDTVQLLRELQPELYSLSIYFPFRGTDLYEYCLKKGYISADFQVPLNFVSRRDTLLRMPNFTRNQIIYSVRTFSWKIYKNYSLKKAMAFWIYETKWGDKFLKYVAIFKKLLRKNIIAN